jgi:hypothetical protein
MMNQDDASALIPDGDDALTGTRSTQDDEVIDSAADGGTQSSGDDNLDASEELDFEEVLDADPAGAPLLDKLERLMIVTVFATTALTAVAWDFSVSLGWFFGALLSFTSVAVLRRLMRKLLAGGVGATFAAVILGAKALFVLAAVFLVLTRLPASPIAFAGGHLAVVAGLVIGSVLMAPRPQRGVGFSGPSDADDDDGE